MRRLARLFMIILSVCAVTGCSTRQPERRLILLGFDGADPDLVERWMAEGKLPNLKQLQEQGCYRRLATSNPAQSPTAWACFETGLNPGRTGVFGFLRRVNSGSAHRYSDGTPMPEISYVTRRWEPVLGFERIRTVVSLAFGVIILIGVYVALTREALVGRAASLLMALALGVGGGIALNTALHEWLPTKIMRPKLARHGDDFWKLLGKADVPSKVLGAPLSFPAGQFPNCKLLSGLGTPDLKGTHGTWAVYSSESPFPTVTETGGAVFPVKITGNKITTAILGPDDPIVLDKIRRLQPKLAMPKTSESERKRLQQQLSDMNARRELRTALRIRLYPSAKMAYLSSGLHRCSVRLGEWSKWMPVTFHASPLVTVHGMVRFYLAGLAPKFELYMSPIAIDPSRVPRGIAISAPPSYAKTLAREVGPYDTLGWSAPTNPLKDEKLDDNAFMKYVWESLQQRHRMVVKELDKGDWVCFCAIFEEPDHASHMMWRFEDKTHPMYNAKQAAAHGDDLLKLYRYMDRIVGEVRAGFVDQSTELIVLSDHGFKSFRQSVNINNWLMGNGYLFLREPSSKMKLADLSHGNAPFFSNVDWTRTRAYSMELGKIYINLRGREPRGIVPPGAEYEGLCREIADKFQALADPQTGAPVVHKVYRREDIFKGPFVKNEADLIVGFNAGYRVSWQTCLGGMGQDVIEPNLNAWSGDHCSLDPSLVPGIFFSNCKMDREAVSIMDIAPSVLRYFDVTAKGSLDGKAFSLVRR